MTAEQKASELIAKQFDVIAKASNYKGLKVEGAKKFYLIEKISKQCSIIAVDEILNTLNQTTLEYEFFEEVKQEIEKK